MSDDLDAKHDRLLARAEAVAKHARALADDKPNVTWSAEEREPILCPHCGWALDLSARIVMADPPDGA